MCSRRGRSKEKIGEREIHSESLFNIRQIILPRDGNTSRVVTSYKPVIRIQLFHVRSEILKAVTRKNAMPSILVSVVTFRGIWCQHYQCTFLPDHMTSHPRRQSSSQQFRSSKSWYYTVCCRRFLSYLMTNFNHTY